MLCRIIFLIILISPCALVFASKSDIGLTCDKEIIGANRYIEVGDTVSYTLEYLEKNKYRCSEFQGRVREIVFCSYASEASTGTFQSYDEKNRGDRKDNRIEILLTVENGRVTEIETRLEGVECN